MYAITGMNVNQRNKGCSLRGMEVALKEWRSFIIPDLVL
jgi:hypothetical protein